MLIDVYDYGMAHKDEMNALEVVRIMMNRRVEAEYKKEIDDLKEELTSQKMDRLKDRMKDQTNHRIQYAELHASYAKGVNEITTLKEELKENTRLFRNCRKQLKRKTLKQNNLNLMGVDPMYDPPDYWD
jgi:DNA repair exonuclease SbcCD ATPase subunit